MKKINEEIEEVYNSIIGHKDKKEIKQNYLFGLNALILLLLYLYFDKIFILILFIINIIAIFTVIVGIRNYKQGFKEGYKVAKGINLDESNK